MIKLGAGGLFAIRVIIASGRRRDGAGPGEKVVPAVSMQLRSGRGCHAFLALRGMHHLDDGPSLFMLTSFAREMRKAPTRSEALLWAQLRGGKLGVRVRRQHVLHPCIVDFFVPSRRLVVEVDGGVHRAQRERDRGRDAFLSRVYGVRVLRIDAELVERDVRAAVAIVRAAL